MIKPNYFRKKNFEVRIEHSTSRIAVKIPQRRS